MGTKGESEDPGNLSLTIPVQGVLPNLCLLAVMDRPSFRADPTARDPSSVIQASGRLSRPRNYWTSDCRKWHNGEEMAYLAQPVRHSSTDTSESVVVRLAVCQKLADWLSARQIPEDREDSSLQGLSREEIGNFYLLLVAICHQTSPRNKPPLEGTVHSKRLRG